MIRWRTAQLVALTAAILVPAVAFAEPLTTTHYRLDPDVDASFGGAGGSTDYGLVDSGGEAAVGLGSSASYQLGSGYVAQLEQSIQLDVLPAGITSYYPLDTNIGAVAYDSSAAAHDGTLQNGPAWVAGKIGQGLSFNGTNQYVSTTASFSNPSTFTLEGWFKTGSSSGGRLIGFGDAATGPSTNADRAIYMTDVGNLVFGANPGTKHTVVSGLTYNDNAWHHVAATMGAGGMHLYVDGVADGTPDANTAGGNYTGSWRMAYDNLGGWPSAPTSNYFAGRLDEVKIYNRALSTTEIAGEYAAGQAGVVSAQTIPTVSAGASQSALTNLLIRTDAGGYNLGLSEDHDLLHTDASTTIAPVSGSISSPAGWTEGSTKGLGFSLTAGPQIEGKWGTSPNFDYAAIPTTPTTFHSRTGLTGGAVDSSTVQFRLDVTSSQKAGNYANTLTFTATVIP